MRKAIKFGKVKQAGFTLVEFCVTVTLIAIAGYFLSGPIVAKWATMRAGWEATAASQLTQAVKNQAPTGTFPTGSLATALPDDIKGNYTNTGTQAAPVFNNRYGGQMTATGAGATATINQTNYPAPACKQVVLQINKDFNTDASITAGSTNFAAGSSVTATQAAAACVASLNTVSWTVTASQ